jgi:dTDP-4-dehydrorhamnose 3,5-epimerase
MTLEISTTTLPEVRLLKPGIFEDHRGTYVETWNRKEYEAAGIKVDFVRDDISTSSRGVLRGIHYDDKTWKLIQCMWGRIFFVVVDMRPESPNYLHWESFILSDTNRHQVLVPPHFGNAHLVLSESCIFHYKMSAYYDPENERGVRWDDPKLGIFWPVSNPVLSLKDSRTPYL